MMYFIGSSEYRVTFLVKIRRFNGHRKWLFLHSWAVVLGQIFRQIVSIRVMTLIDTNVVASRHIRREEVLLAVAVRSSKTLYAATKTSRIPRNLNFLGETASIWGGGGGGDFLFRISE